MSKIEIRGVIVPSMYDDEYFWPYIQRGLITPESFFRKNLRGANKQESLEVYINSPGGSVFAGNEMINALRDWKMENKQTVNFTVGAMSASMASAMLVFAADSVKLHKNSKIMFHGVITGTEGGEGAHKDALELISKMNAELKTVLVSRFKLAPEKVDEWFAEGRMGWLSADEAKSIGLANEVIGDDANENKESNLVFNQMQQGFDLAACLKNIENPEEKMINKVKELFALDPAMQDGDVEKFVETLKRPGAVEAAYDEGMAAGVAKGKAEACEALKVSVEEANQKVAEITARMESKFAETEALKLANLDMSAKMEKLTAGLSAPEPDAPKGSVGFFAQVSELVSNGMTHDEAMIKVQREHPQLFAEMLGEANKR